MNMFIFVYHIVRDFFTFPFRIIKRVKNKRLIDEVKEERRIKEEKMKAYEEGKMVDEASSLPSSENFIEKKQKTKKDAVPRVTFEYEAVNKNGQTVKSTFDAISESEVRAFLINEGYKVIKIGQQSKWNLNIEIGTTKLSTAELTFALTQLSTYIRAGIPLIDSVRILAKQTVNPSKRKIFERIVYDLVTGENLSTALENQEKVFPRLLINMIKTAEMTGDLPSVLDEMSEYYTSIEQTKKQMMSALIYPAVILIVSIAVVVFCLMKVVPTFVNMYSSSGTKLPAVTQLTLDMSNFLQNNYVFIIIVIAVIILSYYEAYKNVKSFRRMMQTLYMKIPVIGNIIIYKEVMMFTKTFSSLLNHNVNITQTMEVLSKISSNEIYKEIIFNTIENLKKGGKISDSFRGEWAFPIVAYEMLVTGESTGQLGLMMEKVADHYSNLHKSSVAAIKSLVEPITIVFLAFCVGFILISMFIPMFESYGTIG